jgi:hypothetical protein
MKKILLSLVILFIITVNLNAQNNDDMKKWMDYMTPGKEHQDFAKMNGDWAFTSKFWMDPNAQPQTSNGTAKFEMLLDGRYQQLTVAGKMMGMDFKGIGINGYDNAKKVYVSSWIDNFGTGLMYMEGKYDEASKKIVYTGKMVDPMTGKDGEYKQTIKVIDDKNFEMDMYDLTKGTEVKTMEIMYTKK